MKLQYIVIYILATITLATAIIYFILAANHYIILIDFSEEEIEDEISKLQIEIAFFTGLGIIYLTLFGWIFTKKLKSLLPYSLLIFISIILIIIYYTSMTVGIPILDAEFFMEKYDTRSKVLQGIIIAISIYIIYKIKINRRK
ncbi:MAG TPA: hypothetical protein VJ697_09385 [Nitrososphaeraceae archaeon]|nr:hypothetical protein [Nitrososphaeraceae archaeon]